MTRGVGEGVRVGGVVGGGDAMRENAALVPDPKTTLLLLPGNKSKSHRTATLVVTLMEKLQRQFLYYEPHTY